MVDLNVPEYKKTSEWYKNVVLWVTSYYNRPLYPFSPLGLAQPLTPIDEMNRCQAFYFDKQGVSRYAPVFQNTVLANLPSSNNQIFKNVNALHGKMVEFMAKFNIATEVLSPESLSTKEGLRNMMYFMVTQRDLVLSLQSLGIMLEAMPEEEIIETKEDVDDYIDTKWRDKGALYAERLAKSIIKLNDYATMKSSQFLDVIICGVTATDRYIKNGIVVEQSCVPQSLILDLRNKQDNNYNTSAWFAGLFENLISVNGVLEKYGEAIVEKYGTDALQEIRDLASTTSQGSESYFATFSQRYPAQTTPNFSWWSSPANASYVSGMSVAKVYFKALYDPRYKISKGRYVKERDYDEQGKPIAQNMMRKGLVSQYRWHQAVLIANKWVVETGLVPNALYDNLGISDQLCPMTRYIDNYTGGYYMSRVSRMIPIQEDINLAYSKMKLAEINDLGVNYIIMDGGADSTKTIQDIYADFQSQHMTMLKKDLENPDLIKQQFAEVVDFTGSLKVADIYMKIINYLENILAELMHLPNVAQGLQQSTIGKGVQQGTVSLAAVGVAPLFNGFVGFIQRDVQQTTNMQKLVLIEDDTNDAYWNMILGDAGLTWMKNTDELFQMLGIYINPYDQIDEINRQQLQTDIQAGLQNGLIEFEDVIKLRTISSYREALAYISRVTKKRKKEQMAMAEQQRQDNLMMAQQNQQAMIAKAQIPAQAQVESAEKRKEATMYQADKSAETKQHDTNTNASVKLATHTEPTKG